ncbi:hypothetical protein SEA_BILO_31 [Streptomyces phage Bilo]|nr:hypothetical protein SEA_BILO_31 [Streptomyces phage Bilo]
MKFTAFQLFKMAFAVAAGYELGRTIPVGLIQVLHKRNREQIKQRYREGLQAVPDYKKARETPTGD